MRKLILHSILLLSVFSISSCNYLDVDKWFDDTMKYDSIFSRKEYLERYMWNVASMFPDEGDFLNSPATAGPLATDEAFETFNAETYTGMAYVTGAINEENITNKDAKKKKSIYQWDTMYKIIRKANIILSRMDEVTDMSNLEKPDIWAYTYFMRAYAYYHLIMDFGPVILVGDQVYPSNEQPEAYANVRATYDESVDYACEQFELAAQYLPETQPNSSFGRPTKGAAYALIARLRLIQASPLYNGRGQTYFGNWKRSSDGVFYISQQYDDRKWAVAAAACERVMDMGRYELHTVPADKDSFVPPTNENQAFPNGVGGIDPLKSYSYMFNGETDGRKNKEFIWGRTTGNLCIRESFPHSMDGYNGMGVTQKMVNMFHMNDGTDNYPEDAKPYKEDGTYDNTNFSTEDETFSEYVLKSGVFNMYRNREMRFYANIGFSGRFWKARSYSGSDAKKEQMIKYDNSSVTDGKHSSSGNVNNYPATGYVITKYVHDDDAFSSPGGILMEKFFPIIRYAEILLAYSEALNNLQGSYSIELKGSNGETKVYEESRDIYKIKQAFNPIRYRVGLPGVKDDELASVDGFNKILQRERAIEFLYENQRYYDVRRWGIYEESEKEAIQGMDLSKDEMSGYFYPVVVDHPWIRHRVVDRKMVFLPIGKYEIRKVDGLDQNPGWGD